MRSRERPGPPSRTTGSAAPVDAIRQFAPSTSPVCTNGLPRLRETNVPRPVGIGRGRTPARRSPSAGSPARTTPWAPNSFMRWMNGSYAARPAPAVERAMMKRTPTSRAKGSSSVSLPSGLPLGVDTRS